MKRIITIQWSILNLFILGISPLWYWQDSSIDLNGNKEDAGYRIYGVELKILGFCICLGTAFFKKHLYIKKNCYFSKNIEIN